MKNIIFLFTTPAVEGDENKFSLLRLHELGFCLTIYDLTPVLCLEIESKITRRRIHAEYIDYNKITDMSQLEKAIREHWQDSFFLPMFDDYYQVRKIYSLFTKYKVRYGYVNNLVCEIEIAAGNNNRLGAGGLSAIKIRSALYNRIIRKVIPNRKAEFIAFGSKSSEKIITGNCLVDKNTKRLYLHTYDCQRFIDTVPYDNHNRKYCVFLDQYIPFHPDNVIDRGLRIDAEIYYREVCGMLDCISQKFDMDVIIAAHPRADYENQHKIFPKSYKIETGKTTELIKNAALVIGHFSTAIGLVSLVKVPLYIFLPPSIFDVDEFRESGIAFSKLLGCRIIKEPYDIQNANLSYDSEKYQSFAETYMTCNDESDQLNLWDTMSRYLS